MKLNFLLALVLTAFISGCATESQLEHLGSFKKPAEDKKGTPTHCMESARLLTGGQGKFKNLIDGKSRCSLLIETVNGNLSYVLSANIPNGFAPRKVAGSELIIERCEKDEKEEFLFFVDKHTQNAFVVEKNLKSKERIFRGKTFKKENFACIIKI